MKKLVLLSLIVMSNNFLFSMEVKRNSLASFFGIDQICPNEDISQNIAHHYAAKHQWWYVDKEIQFLQSDDIPMHIDTRNSINYAYLSNDGTRIIGMPKHIVSGKSCFKCVWDRQDGKELERIDCKTNSEKQGDEKFFQTYVPCIPFFSLENKFDQEEKIWLEQLREKYPTGITGAFRTVRITYNLPFNNSIAYVWHRGKEKKKLIFLHKNKINWVGCNQAAEEIITASDDCTMRLWNGITGEELLCITYDTRVNFATFNSIGTEIVVATDAGKVHVLVKYDTYTLPQILLKKLLDVWLQVEKPSKEIDSSEKLLNVVAQLLSYDRDEIDKTWLSFSKNMQEIVWQSMYKKIQKYGK